MSLPFHHYLVWPLAIAIAGLSSVTAQSERPPNIILILADDLGYGDLGCFGQSTLKTPHLDRMAAEGLRFTQFYSGSTVCAPSRSVLLTGKHMGHTTVRGNSTEPIVIRPGEPTLASVLKQAGYTTACIGKWGVGTPDKLSNPNDVGFDHFFGYVDMWHAHNFYPEFLIRNGEVVPLENEVEDKWKPFQDPHQPKGGRGFAKKRVQYAPDLFAEDAESFIRENHEEPFFLYYAMNVPHTNNEGGPKGMEVPDLAEFANKDWPDAEKGFAAMIRNIDQETGKVLALLKELEIAGNTPVLFTSDNGPHQESGHDPERFDSNGPYRGVKRDLYEGGIRVPTIAWWPGTITANTTNGHQWYFGDFMATFCELAGIDPPANIDSDSLVPTMNGQPPEKEWHRESTLYWEFYERGSAQAVRFGKWKAVRKPMFTGPIELYDLSWDIGETRDYAERRPKLVEHAKNLMAKAHTPDPNWKVRRQKNRPAKSAPGKTSSTKPKVWIYTDMSDQTLPGNNHKGTINDPDDISAMAGYLLMANEFETLGIVVASTHRKEHRTTPNQAAWAEAYLGEAYRSALPHLRKWRPDYPDLPAFQQSGIKESAEHYQEDKTYASLDAYPTVNALLQQAKQTQDTLNVLCWGSLTEPAILVNHCLATDQKDVLRRLRFIAHWTNSPHHQGTSEHPENVANCREDSLACAYLKARALEGDIHYHECGAIGQHGIVSGAPKGREYFEQFHVSQLGKIFATGKWAHNGVDHSDSATYWALLGHHGVDLNAVPDNGTNPPEIEKANEQLFRRHSKALHDELLKRAQKASSL